MHLFTSYANDDDTGLAAALTQADDALRAGDSPGPRGRLDIHADRPRQPIDGFGASMTEASAYLFQRRMKDPGQVLHDLFDVADGIGLSLLRQPIGPTDHVTRPFGFLRRLPDPRLSSLDFRLETERILPVVRAAHMIRERSLARAGAVAAQRVPLRIIASPWSAPPSMKTNLSWLGQRRITGLVGRLRRDSWHAYAELIARFVDLYRAHGIDVLAVTPVNEPDNAQSQWPSMAMAPREQARFVVRALAPALRARGLLGQVGILCWDHNYSTDRYPDGRFVRDVYADPAALAVLAGSAWHYYGGASRTLEDIHRAWPGKGIWVTEASGGDWGPRNWDDALVSMGGRVIAMMNHWARCAILWNVALDSRGGPDWYYRRDEPHHALNRGLVAVDAATGAVTRNADWYVLGHFSRFVAPGSVCVEHALSGVPGLHAAAFRTTAHGTVAVVANENRHAVPLDVTTGETRMQVLLPARSLSTLTECREGRPARRYPAK